MSDPQEAATPSDPHSAEAPVWRDAWRTFQDPYLGPDTEKCIRDDEWTAKNDLHRMNLGYPYPEENYLVRRHPATSWEPFTPTGKNSE